MNAHLKRWLLGAVGLLAFVLAACSTPQTPEPPYPENPVVELDGFRAQIDVAKLDLQPMSFWHAPTVTCPAGDRYEYDHVSYAQLIVPMLAFEDGRLTAYGDVFWIPRPWNGDLAVYAHGYIAPDDPGFLEQLFASGDGAPNELLETRDKLLCQGYALGASAFSKKGFAVEEGVRDTHLLRAVFRYITWKKPQHTYVFGSSLGGLIALQLAEEFPRAYAGAMPTCGPIGGSMLELNYVGNVRLLYDDYIHLPGPGGTAASYLGGTLLTPPATSLTDDQLRDTVLATTSDGSGGLTDAFLGLDHTWLDILKLGAFDFGTSGVVLPLLQTPRNFGQALATGLGDPTDQKVNDIAAQYALYRALRYDVRGANDIYARGSGWPFDNRSTLYGDATSYGNAPTGWFPWADYEDPFYDDAIAPDSSAQRYFAGYPYFPITRGYYRPTGRTSVPILSLHTAFDPDVPVAHELVYRQLALAGGASGTDFKSYVVAGTMPTDLNDALKMAIGLDLSGQAVPFGHCNFTSDTLVEGFDVLVGRSLSPTHTWPTPDPTASPDPATGFVPVESVPMSTP